MDGTNFPALPNLTMAAAINYQFDNHRLLYRYWRVTEQKVALRRKSHLL